MNSLQESKRSMYLLVAQFLGETDPAVLAKMPNFTPQQTSFTASLDEIQRLSEQQGYSRKGYTMEKQEAREAMTVLTLDVMQRVKAYALNEGNAALYEKMNKSRSSLNKLNDTVIMDYANYVILETTPLLASLTDYGVTAAVLTSLSDLIVAYEALITVPKQEITNRRDVTFALGLAFKTADLHLNFITKLVAMLEFSEPVFYRMFMHKRVLVEHGSRKISFLGLISGEGLQPLEKVLVNIPGLKRSTYSTDLGHFEFKHLPEGDHFVTFSRPGYHTYEAVVSITSTLQTKLDVSLKESALQVA